MSLRERLKAGEVIVGSWLNTGSPIVAELMAASGFDFLAVDTEHSAVDAPQALAMFQAIAAGWPDCAPLVRLPGNDYAVTKRFLDAGAEGVIAPLINSGEEVRRLIRSVKYPPLGERGVGFGRSHGYGFEFDAYMARADRDLLTCVQIEHIDAVRHIDEILAPDAVDAAFIGPYDLTASMGVTAQFNHSDYLAALERVLAACREHGVAPGIHVVPPKPDQVADRIAEGFRLIAYSLDLTLLGTACRDGLARIREFTQRTGP
jgi:2-dehydro-3-deoxyglucarate aldolase